ncbi:heat shock protein GrpE [Blastochloris viridis]|uniref:Protein GrpE n=1 Tax=Blastochloris viridis TaxID=1079 RepID=A0A182D3L2_BLAVI|nr:heat shock protein GrpE [Blastochloris viridis]
MNPEQAAETAADAAPADRAAPADATQASAPQPNLEALAAEAADLRDKLLRTLAEMENLRRRTEREVADAKSYAIAAFARDVLNVADNMERALAAVPADAVSGDAALTTLVEGVELTERELAKTLEKHGVRRVEAAGGKFDPNLHQAMFEIPNPDVPTGTVVQVVQTGYVLGERILRPALVGVAKGGPKVAPEAPPPSEPSDRG